MKAWCDKRKGKRLFELQIELCQSAIKTIPTLNEIPDGDKAKAIAAIRRQIETLKALEEAGACGALGIAGAKQWPLHARKRGVGPPIA